MTLSRKTSIFGLHLWVVLGVCVGAAIVLILFLISLWFTSKRNNTHKPKPSHQHTIPNVSRDIQEIRIDHARTDHSNGNHARVQPNSCLELEQFTGVERQALLLKPDEENPIGYPRIHIEIGKDHRIVYPERFGGLCSHGCNGETRLGDQVGMAVPEVSHLGWGHWYTLRELEASTNGFADENVIGEGGYGIVYHGVLQDNTQIAVKNLLNNRCLLVSYIT
ncbi:unnamed protein product [Ilex paraguariensis]|uniref:non-specific serine/threonine protein kinase n=1 Tax=Ilex paraguariensis TaxID=185542 RepID=A0ABC8UC35_9AQUA